MRREGKGGLTTFPRFKGPALSGDYSLRVFEPVNVGQRPLGIFHYDVDDWARSRTFTGGPWLGSFTLYGDLSQLEDWFYTRLGAHIEEHSYGQQTWEGLVWEMDLVAPDAGSQSTKRWKRRRMTYDRLFNRVRCDYTDPATSTSGSTSWVSDTKSIGRFGQKEEIIRRDMNATNALEAANEFLGFFAHPQPQLVAFEKPQERAFLEVTVAGYIATAQFRFTATADDSTSTVFAWVEDVFDTDLEFLTKVRWNSANTRSIKQSVSSPIRAWDLLEDLLTLRDGSGNRFNIDVWTKRRIQYKIWSSTPVGLLRQGKFRGLGGEDLEDTARLLKPGIYRDMDYLAEAQQRRVISLNSFFETPADFLLETVEVAADGTVVPRLGVYDEEEALRSFSFKDKEG